MADNKLKEGYQTFLNDYFDEHQELFEKLANQQNPHTMVITCSDSRIDPTLILGAKPGDLFILRNIGNVVPKYQKKMGATKSAIEYAVNVLHVSKIIVIGHSNCGACAHLYHEHNHKDDTLHNVEKWLEQLDDAKHAAMLEAYKDPTVDIFESTEKHNVITSAKRLMSYPYIQDKILNHKIDVAGWWYEIQSGKIEVYDPAKNRFEPLI